MPFGAGAAILISCCPKTDAEITKLNPITMLILEQSIVCMLIFHNLTFLFNDQNYLHC